MRNFQLSAFIAPLVVIALGMIFLAVPWLSALILGGAVLSFGFLYLLIVYRFQKFQKDSHQGFTRFEQRVYSHGTRPNFKTITISMFDNR